MKNWLFGLVVLMNIVACKDKLNQLQSVGNKGVEKRFYLSEHLSKFKYHNLTEFRVDNSCHDQFIKLDSFELKQVLQYEVSNRIAYYFYSTFKDTSQITVLCEDEILDTSSLMFLDYDKKGKLKKRIQIAYSGADEDANWVKFGTFLNDCLYLNTNIDLQIDWKTKNTYEHRWVSEWTFFQDKVGMKIISDKTVKIK